MAKGLIKKVFTVSFKSKPVIKYSTIAFGSLILLLIIFKLVATSSPVFGTIGFYFLFIPLWLIASIGILKLLSLTAKILSIVLGILFITGLIFIFAADKPVEGMLALGPVGIVIVFLLNIIITSFLISLIPGVLAGLFVGGFIASKADSGLAFLLGLIVLVVVTAAIFKFIWKWVIPFSIGFSISLFVGNIIGAVVSVIFSSYRIVTPDITRFVSNLSRFQLSRPGRGIEIILRSLENLWESIKIFWNNYTVIFIGAVIFGIVFAAVLGSEKDEKNWGFKQKSKQMNNSKNKF